MCWTPERVRLAGFRCPASLFFFFWPLQHSADVAPTWLPHIWHASSEKKKKKKKKRKKITDFETHFSSSQPILPLTSARCRCPLFLAGARSGRSASSIDDDTVPCPFRSLSLSLGVDNSSDLFSSSLLSLFLFFYFFNPTLTVSLSQCHCYCVSLLSLFFFCLINYNVYYEFSDFCFYVSCYGFIYLLKLNIVGDFTKMNYCTTLGVSLLICSSYII